MNRLSLSVARKVLYLGMGGGLLLQATVLSGSAALSRLEPGEKLSIQRFRLLNGLAIQLLQRQATKELALNLLIKSGSTRDPVGSPGVAALTARHLMDRDPAGQNNLEALGIALQVDVQPDATIFRATLPPRRLRIFLGLLGAQLVRPQFEADGERAGPVVKDDPPGNSQDALADFHFRKAIFGRHPYGNSSGQTGISETLLPKELEDFRSQHYIPNNASLIVVGPIASEDLLDLARERLGPWTKRSLPEATYPDFPRLERLSIQLLEGGPLCEEAGILFGHTAPDRLSTDFYRLKVLNLILGGLGSGSRLSSAFLSRQISYRLIDSRIRFYRAGGMLQVLAKVPEAAAPAALAAIVEAVESLKQSPVSGAELESAKAQLITRHSESLRSPHSIAEQLTRMELFSLSKDFLDRFADKVRGLTAEELQEAAKTHLSTTRAVAVVTGVGQEVRSELIKLGSAEVVSLPRSPTLP